MSDMPADCPDERYWNMVVDYRERNAKLVSALEFFADGYNWRHGGRCDPNSGNFDGTSVARNALQQSTEKP